jgi:hypothetical protein
MSSDPFEMFDGAYVLGALSDEDRRAYETHLRECDACAASLRELQDLPAALATVSPAALSDEPPPVSLLPALERRVRRDRNRRRWIVGGLTAAAAACIVSLAVVATSSSDGGKPGQHQVAMKALKAVPIRATVDVESVGWGTRIDMVCMYSQSVKAGHPYALVVVDRKGGTHELGTWNLVPGKEAKYESGTSLHRDEIKSVQITGYDDPSEPLLTLDL